MKFPFFQKEASDVFQEASQWEISTNVLRDKSEQRAWRFAFGMFVVAVGVIGLQFAGRPKIIEKPTIIKVDEIRGTVEMEQSLQDAKTTYSEALMKRDLRVYVRSREAYSRASAEDSYSAVKLMSSEQERQRYQAYFNPGNPGSPLNLYGADGRVRIVIKSVNFLPHNQKVATVRYAMEEFTDGLATTPPKRSHWISTINFSYINPPLKDAEREVNPLGFQVSEYRKDPDSGEVGMETSP